MGKYDEIMSLPHHESSTRPRMPMSDRAAQFAPFAALTGYDAAIRETGRLTDAKIEPDGETLTELNLGYALLRERMEEFPPVTVTYFQPDSRKEGGAYLTVTAPAKKLDESARLLTLQNGTAIPLDAILALEVEE